MATPGLVFRISTAMESTVTAPSSFTLAVPNTGAGNCLVLFFQTGTASTVGATPVSDDQGNTWAQAKTVSGNQNLYCYVATNVAANTTKITISFTAGDAFDQIEYSEWYNISTAAVATALDGTGSAGTVAGSPVATGAITTTTDGDLVLQWVTCDGGTAVNTSFTAGSGFTFLTANTVVGEDVTHGGPFVTSAVQYQVQTTHGSITPSMTLVGGTSPSSDTLAIALKSASAGTAPGAGIRVAGIQKSPFSTSRSSITLQFPHTGNLIVAQSTHDHAISTITDGDSNTWDHSHSFTALTQLITAMSYAKNVAANTNLKTLKITWTGALAGGAVGFVTLYDIVGADTSAPLVGGTYLSTNSGTQSTNANLGIFAGLTPTNQNDVILMEALITRHTVSGLVAPTQTNGGRAMLFDFSAADGAGTTAEDDDFHGFWMNGTTTASTAITLSIQNNGNPTVGVGDWTATAAEFTAPAAAGTTLVRRTLTATGSRTGSRQVAA